MLRSLYSAVSGTKAHQSKMDVIGNNIANVNTISFKSGRATFQEVMAQTLRSGFGPSEGNARGSINPMQIGMGTMLMNVESNFGQGNLQGTGKETDLAIQGDGFFITRDGYKQMYTRDGHFSIDSEGYLVVPSSGARVQGYSGGGENGSFDPDPDRSSDLTDLQFKVGVHRIVKATGSANFEGNLSTKVDEDSWTCTARVFNALGEENAFTVTFTKQPAPATNTWDMSIADPSGLITEGEIVFGSDGTVQNVRFDANGDGALDARTIDLDGDGTFDVMDADGDTVADYTLEQLDTDGDGLISAAERMSIQVDFADAPDDGVLSLDFSGLTQFLDHSSVKLAKQDGYPVGVLEDLKINTNGHVIGRYSNQQVLLLGQVALASFSNSNGLVKVGSNSYQATLASGERVDSLPGLEGSGLIRSMQLEMSNVDLTEEFTDMIVTQRGLQANTKVITTSDEILQELINIKR